MNTKSFFFDWVVIGLDFILGSCQGNTKERAAGQPAGFEVAVPIQYGEDRGGEPWVLDIEQATLENGNYRAAAWTGANLQLVFMTLKPGEVIDLEMHEGHDQFIRIEAGEARVLMGKSADDLFFDKKVSDDWAVLVPAGYWHKIENAGTSDLKLYSLYGPPEHGKGTLHETCGEAEEAHHHEHAD